MAEIINNIKAFKNLRNKNVFTSYDNAVAAITGTTVGVEDGQIALARYYDGSETMTTKGVKTAIGVYHKGLNVTDGRGAEGWTVYSNDDDIIAKKFDDVATAQTDAIKTAIEALDANVTSTGTSELVTVNVVEEDGKITEVNVTDSIVEKIKELIKSSLGEEFTGETIADYVEEQITDALDELDFTGATGGSVITQVTQTNGKVSATAANLTSEDKTVKIDGLDLAVNIDGETIVKDSDGKISVASSAITLNGKDAIEVTATTTGNEVSLKIDGTDKVLTQGNSGLLANLELKYTKATETEKGKIELIGKGGVVIGTAIDTTDFTVDGFLKSVAWKGDGSNILVFTWNTDAGETVTDIDLTKYIDTYTNGDGLNLNSDTKTFSVKVKDGDKYLTVDGEGVASKDIDDAISSAVKDAKEELVGNAEELTDLGLVEGAINDLAELVGEESVESQIEAAIAELDAEVESTGNTFVKVKVTEEDGVITEVNVTETDIASATALTAEVTARKAIEGQTGTTYEANTGATYINEAESLNDADVKLDAAIKAVADKVGEESVEDQIEDAIEELTENLSGITGSDKDGEYVYDVKVEDGKITILRKAVVSTDTNNILKTGFDGGVFLGNVFDCGYWDSQVAD